MSLSFGGWLQKRRKALDLTQATLAQRANCSLSTLKKIEAGVLRPSRQLADLLTEVLDVPTPQRAQLIRWARAAPGTPWEDISTDPLPCDLPGVLNLRYQLRPPAADFVGRVSEAEQLIMHLRTTALAGSRAVMSGVQGMGGIGKTELAHYVAHQLRPVFPDAQIMLHLQGSTTRPLTAKQALEAAIHALTPGVQLPDSLPELQQHYYAALYGQRVLILADDAHDATQVHWLIPPSGCALLVTSRQRFSLPGMAALQLEPFKDDEASRLLQNICPRLTSVEAQALAHACGQLPLAVRISGGILCNDPALQVKDYLAQLSDGQQRLAQLRDPDAPHLNVETSLALSYKQLDVAAQQVFRQLGVLVTDFNTQLALAVIEPKPGVEAEAVLHQLLRWNLILYDVVRARWRLHDLVRDLALQCLQAAGEWQTLMWRYAYAVVDLAQAIRAQYLSGGDGVPAALARFDLERLHMDAVRHWASDHAGIPEGDRLLVASALALRTIGPMRYDQRHDFLPYLEMALAAAQRLNDRFNEGVILNTLGITCYYLGDARQAIAYFEQRLANARELGDRSGEAEALGNLGLTSSDLGSFRQAIIYYEQDLAITRTLGDRRGEGKTLNNLGNAYLDLGDARRALKCYAQRLRIAYEKDDRRGLAITLDNLGNAYTLLGEYHSAIDCHQRACLLSEEMGDQRNQAIAWNNLGNAYLQVGNVVQAVDAGERSLSIIREIHNRRLEGYTLSCLAQAHAAQGDESQAMTMFQQALTILQEMGDRCNSAICGWHFGLFLMRQGESERALPLLRASVDYEQEIGHTQAAEHAALLAQLEASGSL